MNGEIKINNFSVGGDNKLLLIAGPCVIESKDLLREVASEMAEISDRVGVNFVFKASFDKANRSSLSAFRGFGIDKGLSMLQSIKDEFNLPIITDVHEPWQCKEVAEVVDIIQIPAFLARQTDLLIAAAQTGLPLNIKKGQFMAPNDMSNVINKVKESGNDKIMLCERGSTFGYNNLVVDMRSLPIMASMGTPIVFDATHSVQRPGGNGTSTGGDREFVPHLMRAAVATGSVSGIFAEVHPDPDNALSDGPNMLPLSQVEEVLKRVVAIDKIARRS